MSQGWGPPSGQALFYHGNIGGAALQLVTDFRNCQKSLSTFPLIFQNASWNTLSLSDSSLAGHKGPLATCQVTVPPFQWTKGIVGPSPCGQSPEGSSPFTLQITLYLRKSTINCQTNTTTLITPGNIMIIRATIEMTTSHSWCRCWNWWQMGNVQYLLYWVPWYLLCHQFFRQIHSKRHCHTSEILNYPLSNIVTFTTFYSNFFVNWNFSLLKATEDCHHSWYH